MTVLETVLLGRLLRQRSGTTSDYDLRIVYRVLNIMGIRELAMRRFNELPPDSVRRSASLKGSHRRLGICFWTSPPPIWMYATRCRPFSSSGTWRLRRG